jgi:hypothetical protein
VGSADAVALGGVHDQGVHAGSGVGVCTQKAYKAVSNEDGGTAYDIMVRAAGTETARMLLKVRT